MVASGLTNNNYAEDSVDRTQGTLEYCRIHNIGMQAWSLLASWSPKRSVLNDFPELSAKLDWCQVRCGRRPGGDRLGAASPGVRAGAHRHHQRGTPEGAV